MSGKTREVQCSSVQLRYTWNGLWLTNSSKSVLVVVIWVVHLWVCQSLIMILRLGMQHYVCCCLLSLLVFCFHLFMKGDLLSLSLALLCRQCVFLFASMIYMLTLSVALLWCVQVCFLNWWKHRHSKFWKSISCFSVNIIILKFSQVTTSGMPTRCT